MDWGWITTTWHDAAMTVVSAGGIYLAVILYTRMAGLRSFSKMSSFDFAMTVAVGSLIATTVLTKDPPLLQAAAALAALYLLQIAVARLRIRVQATRKAVDNQPILLMEDGRFREGAMRTAGVTQGDVVAKLREANVLRLAQVRAVVMETTGDVSVLHGDADEEVEATLLEGVRR
jgi:uncharacterized membrane protein YcaP (DUF421 family)